MKLHFSGKWKDIKTKLVTKTGTGTEEKEKFREFEVLDEIFGTRPGFNLGGVDSSSKPCSEASKGIYFFIKNMSKQKMNCAVNMKYK